MTSEENGATDARIRSAIAHWGPRWNGLPPLTRETFRVRSKSATIDVARNAAATLTLEGVAG